MSAPRHVTIACIQDAVAAVAAGAGRGVERAARGAAQAALVTGRHVVAIAVLARIDRQMNWPRPGIEPTISPTASSPAFSRA